uniref:Uncharacterized protein n=1 Tax=Avena sativa TaxID=4498 RepID=A0ACD5X8Y9_AVESA
MIRYQVRNEYGLADPDLYAPEEKDDPEALLEGVAMAGLVGVLRQLGDLAEFAAEIFHDLHEDVMATASRGHSLMLRLQQLEAEFPAVEKAIIAQTDHSNYLHDDGIEWHANLQLNQNLITIGDMPRFILDSYEECRGPPHLFTLDKFDVAGAGASLKRYSDPSFFKMEQTSNMIETDYLREKNPRKVKKKAMRRKGETLESLLVANSESQIASSKDRSSRKVPPRTTKLKSRHLWDTYNRTISRICKEQLQEVISSQQKILSNYSARYYHSKFTSTDSSEIISSFGELDNFSAPAQSSAKHELTKVVPVDESDTLVTASVPTNGTVFLEVDDGQFMATQHEHTKMEQISKGYLVEQNDIFSTSERSQGGRDFKDEESNCPLQSVREEKCQSSVVPVNHDDGHCTPDEVGNDQDNFIDALNTDSEGEVSRDMQSERDLSSKIEANKLSYHEEVESALHEQFSELGPFTEPTRAESFLLSDSSPSAVSDAKDTDSDSDSCRQPSGGSWINREPFNDVDLMDVSSSSSVTSDDNGNFESNNNINDREQNQEVSFLPSNDYHAAVPSSDKQLSQRSSGSDGLATSSSDYQEKAYCSAEHCENNVLDGTSTIFGQPNDVSHGGEIRVPDADDLLLPGCTPNHEQIQLSKNQFEEFTSLDTVVQGTASKFVTLPDMDPIVQMNDLELDNIEFPEKINASTTPTTLDPDCIHKHLDDDDEIVEELHCLPAEDLYKHAAADQEIFKLEKGPCPIRLDTHKEDPIQESVVPMHLSNVQAIPALSESASTFQDDTEAHVNETLEPSPRMLNVFTKASFIDAAPASCTAPLLGTSNSCMEYCESIENGKGVELSEVLVNAELAEESVTSMFEDGMIPSEEERTDFANYTEKAVILATDSSEENSMHVLLQSSSPFRKDMETVEATSETLGSLEKSRGHSFKESMSQPDILPEPIEIETSGETFSEGHDIRYVPSLRHSEESSCLEELPEETTLGAEVPCQSDLNKDVAVIMNSNMVEEQPPHVDQDVLSELSSQDPFGTNPFVDPGCRVSSIDPSPGMSYQPYCSDEEQDFLSELLTQHGHTKAKENQCPLTDDSLWESATPPDEAPLPSEVMTEQDFGSFCHEYHEMDFAAATEGFDDEPSSDSNNIRNGCVVSVLDFPCSVSTLPMELDHKADCSKPVSQHPECSSADGVPGETTMPFSAREASDDKTPGADSGSSYHESLHDEKSPILITPSVPVKLEQEQHALHGVDSDSGTGTCLLDNEKIGEIYGSPSGSVAPVREEQETCANLVPHVLINKKLNELDVHFINSLPLEPAVEARGLDELDVLPLSKPVLTQESDVHVLDELNSQTVPSSSIDPDAPHLKSAPWPLSNYEVGELDETPSSNVQVEAEKGSYYSSEFDSRTAPCYSVTDKIDGQAAASSVDGIEVEQGWEACASPELDTPPLSNDLLVEKEEEVCVPDELDSKIASYSLRDKKIYELSCPPLSGSSLVENESEDHVSGDPDSQIAPYSSVNDKIVGSGAATSVSDTDVELGWEACSSPELDSQIAPCPLSDYKVGELDGSPSNAQVEAENGSYYSPEFDSRIAPYSSVNDTEVGQEWEPCVSPELDFQIPPCPLSEDKVGELDGSSSSIVQMKAENGSYYSPEIEIEIDSQIIPYSSVNDRVDGHGAATSRIGIEVEEGWEACASPEFDSQVALGSSNSGALAERSTMTSTSVENCWHSPVTPQTKPFQNVSSEDPEMPPPLPPLQWRLGRPRLGLLSTKERMPDPVMRTTSLPAFSQYIGNSLGSLDRMAEPVVSVSSQDIKEKYQSSMVDDNDKRAESGKSSTLPTIDDVAREDDRPFSEACGNIKHEGHITSSPMEAEEHPNDSGVTEQVSNQQDPQQHLLCSDISDITEHLSHTDRATSEDDKTVDDHNAAGSVHLHTVSSSTSGHISEIGRYQEPQHGESFSGTSDNEYSSNASYEQNNLKDQSITSAVPSDTTKHTGSSSALEQGNSQESQLQERDVENSKGSLSEGPSEPSEERIVSEDYPHDDHNLGREIIHQPNLLLPSNKNKYLGGLGEGSYMQGEQPPVMGWTVGPQMLHPNYGISMEGIQFEPEVTDHRLIRKPISMRNIPRNPLVDAVAAHDRSTMRKVSELAPTTDKPNPDERNLWLEQIKNKTFDLKPVGSAKPTSMRTPARAPTGNLRVAAIIEKANAIRQVVGSDDDDEDDDNWSDT